MVRSAHRPKTRRARFKGLMADPRLANSMPPQERGFWLSKGVNRVRGYGPRSARRCLWHGQWALRCGELQLWRLW